MRVCSALLVIAATLVGNGESSTTSTQTHLSMIQDTNVAEARGRFLRSHRTMEEDDEEDSPDDFDVEERKPLFDTTRLDNALKDSDKMKKLFSRWAKNSYSENTVAAKIHVDVNGGLDQKYISLFTGYKSYLQGWRPQ